MVAETNERRNDISDRPRKLVVYSRDPCHLCDVAKATLEELRRDVNFELEVLDVDSDPEWVREYGDQVPVGFIGESKVFKYRVDRRRLRAALSVRD